MKKIVLILTGVALAACSRCRCQRRPRQIWLAYWADVRRDRRFGFAVGRIAGDLATSLDPPEAQCIGTLPPGHLPGRDGSAGRDLRTQ